MPYLKEKSGIFYMFKIGILAECKTCRKNAW